MLAVSIDVIGVCPSEVREDIVKVLPRSFAPAAGLERFYLLHLTNHAEPSIVWVAYGEDGQPVGVSAAIFRSLRVGDAAVAAFVLRVSAIDPAHRSLGPALAFLRATVARVIYREYALSPDYPGQSMLAVYQSIGAKSLGEEHRLVRLLSVVSTIRQCFGSGVLSSVLGRSIDCALVLSSSCVRLPKWLTAEASGGDFDEEFRRLRIRVCGARKISTDRTPGYLNRPFRNHPERLFFTLTAKR